MQAPKSESNKFSILCTFKDSYIGDFLTLKLLSESRHDPERKICETLPMTRARKASLIFLVSYEVCGQRILQKIDQLHRSEFWELLQSAFLGFRGKFIEANKKLTLLSFLHCPRVSCLNCLHSLSSIIYIISVLHKKSLAG